MGTGSYGSYGTGTGHVTHASVSDEESLSTALPLVTPCRSARCRLRASSLKRCHSSHGTHVRARVPVKRIDLSRETSRLLDLDAQVHQNRLPRPVALAHRADNLGLTAARQAGSCHTCVSAYCVCIEASLDKIYWQ